MGRITVQDATVEQLQALAEQNQQSLDELLQTLIEEREQKPLSLNTLDSAVDAVITVDEQQHIVRFNKGAESIFGYSATDIIGQPLDILLPDSARQAHRHHIHQFARSTVQSRDMAKRDYVQGKRKDGTLFPVEASILKQKQGDKRYYTAILRDVTERQRLLQTVNERRQLLELLTENATDLICLHEPDGTVLYANPYSQQISGYMPEELVGTNPYEYFHEDDKKEIREHHDESLEDQLTNSVIYRFRCKDGSYVWLETFTNPIFDDAGNIQNLVTISRDITARQIIQEELRTERDMLNRIMLTSPSGITVVDRDGNIIFANRRAEAILGIRKEDITARTYNAPQWKHTDYDGNPFPDEQMPFVRVMQTKKPVWEVRHAIEWENGHRIYLSINGAPLFDEDGEVSKVVFTIEDYTQRKLQQDELEAALERERKLNTMKSEFISMVSHEFRTPMAVIMTSTGILRMGHHRMTSDQILERLQKIEGQIGRLDRLVSDVMFINKDDLIGHSLEREPVDIRAFFQSIVELIETAYTAHRPIQVIEETECPPLMLDPSLLHRIFTNLLSNAMKYSANTAPVSLIYTWDKEKLTVLVSDKGIGIPKKDQRKLFEVFHRASNVGQVSGTGLGLAITRRAIEALDGKITFESVEGEGTHFLVSLPAHIVAHV